MTKKEAIEILTGIMNNNFYGGEVQTACRMGIEALSQPSLPSNLDEAAEKAGLEYAPEEEGEAIDLSGQVYETDDINWPHRCGFITGFKTGAEWMAGQGVNADFGVCKLADRAWLTPIDEKKFIQDVFDNFTATDKVIVQVRKK